MLIVEYNYLMFYWFCSRFYIVFFVIIYIKENIIDGEEFLKIGKFYLVRNLVSFLKVYSLKLKFL